jgi:predicted DNA-binding transcriptional regulator YafY
LKPLSIKPVATERFDVSELRGAIRDRRKVTIAYENADQRSSTRTIWPIFIGYMEEVRIIAAWCELRSDFRHFRTDRIRSVRVLEERYPERTDVLRKRWEASHKLKH